MKSLDSLAFQPEAWLLSTHLIFHRRETFYLPSTREYPLWLVIAYHQTLNRCLVIGKNLNIRRLLSSEWVARSLVLVRIACIR